MSNSSKKASFGGAGQRSSTTDATATSPSSQTPPQSPHSSVNGLGRSPSTRQSPGPVSARAAARKPGAGRSNLSMSSVPRHPSNPADDDARAQNAAIIDELKEQVKKAETVSDQYRKQLGVLQLRLDEAVSEQSRLEEQAHEKDVSLNALQAEVKELTRQIRDLQQAHEAERTGMAQEKEQQGKREGDLQSTIQRLKETIAQKELRMNVENDRNLSRSPSFRKRASADIENGQFAPSSQLQRSPSRNNSKLILQKDKLIESLRLELAEAQIKLVEMENMGGGRHHELERELLEARMANARLMEDNESYQLLLSEKTLNGDFSKGDFMHENYQENQQASSGLGSLADELDSVGEGGDVDSRRRLEGEIKTLKDQNKALTLYIERIIGRLLQTEGFEHILDKNDSERPGSLTARHANVDKDLPPPPGEKTEGAGQTLLQRARSVVSGQSTRPKPKQRTASNLTQSTIDEPHIESQPTMNENPDTAPSIPIGRSRHRRTRSDQADGAAAAVVGQMYRGPPSNGPMSPGISPTFSSGQGAFFSSSSMAAKRSSVAVGSVSSRRVSTSPSVRSDRSGEVASTTESTSSPPLSGPGMNNYTGAVMTQNKLRPLRLVQENKELEGGDEQAADEEARKKANRGSWMSWFNRPGQTEPLPGVASAT
ncbi:hypothetical protein PABG_01632 [Paracoccidioides brasiliensis Pb03]|uniref:Uncharacterized protein n=1 Tax=Paracoccidioides brasiliensis TaxID=121759 RepID=A0A1D2JPG2_PARBR|nr:hypothetical protein PABG_01632 [Paracoccidioides brasiliensis Pb03]ODH45090.1 hypothetical protein ACO22_00385 [Paracoccidioides brasiliensis]ODH47289.1 hypothetical protein GX48_06630 [Paracoccidioides brasiliensis]